MYKCIYLGIETYITQRVFFVHMPRGIAIGLEDFFATKKYEDWMHDKAVERDRSAWARNRSRIDFRVAVGTCLCVMYNL